MVHSVPKALSSVRKMMFRSDFSCLFFALTQLLCFQHEAILSVLPKASEPATTLHKADVEHVI